MTRGYFLNNPFNIEQSNIQWQGMVQPSSDPVFCQFSTPLYGLRAGFIDLKSQLNGRFDTITKLITKYAPPSENNTAAYITAVSTDTGIDPNATLQYADLKAVGLAIIKHEQGCMIYADDIISQALALAGLPV